MGVNLKDLSVKTETNYDFLKGKVFVVDSFNVLYQFLSSIRQRDGTPLMDSKGRVTSHLIGLFNRTTKLMKLGLRLAFCFDGKPPELKKKERERRANLKENAHKQYKIAEERGHIEDMKKYAQRTSRLSPEMINEAKELVRALGLPVIQAPSEGEAQAAYIVNKGEAYAAVSQDYDCLLFGVKRVIQNLTISEKRKMPSKLSYERIVPTIIETEKVLNEMGINQDQLIILGLLVGTDYNPGGIKGIGPKNALKLVKEHKDDFEGLFKEVKWGEYFDFDWKDAFNLLKNMETTDDYELKWSDIDREKIIELMVTEHEASLERIEKALNELEKVNKEKSQKGLGDFL
ncbi:flap endonuclease-1 [Nanoarchaeota archaeon]